MRTIAREAVRKAAVQSAQAGSPALHGLDGFLDEEVEQELIMKLTIDGRVVLPGLQLDHANLSGADLDRVSMSRSP